MTSKISTIIKKLLKIVLFCTLLLLLPIVALIYGIKIPNIESKNFKTKGLYIKLDKKLIVEAKKITLSSNNSSSSDTSTKELKRIIDLFPWVNKLFAHIDIEALSIHDQNIKVLYKDDVFYINSELLTLDTKLEAKKNALEATIKSLVFKDFNLSLKGQVMGDIAEKDVSFLGKFKTFDITGDIKLYLKNGVLIYHVKSDEFANLKSLMQPLAQKIGMLPEAREWIYEKIVAKKYQLLSLTGKIDIKKENFFLNIINAKAKVQDVLIKLKQSVPPLHVNTINLRLKNNTLFFELDSGHYQNSPFKGQKAYIYNLLTEKNGIVLNLSLDTMLDKEIQKILQAYKLKIPLIQNSGNTHANLKLDVRFVPYDIDVKGDFLVKNSHFLLSDVPFFTKEANLSLNNRNITFHNTNLQYQDIFDINTTGTLDMYKYLYQGDAHINRVSIKNANSQFLHVENVITPVKINIEKNNTHIHVEKFHANLSFQEKTNIITQDDLSLLQAYSPFMKKFGIKGGAIGIQTADFRDFGIDANITNLKPFLLHKGTPLEKILLHVDILGDRIVAFSTPNVLNLKADKNTTSLVIKNSDLLVGTNSTKTSKAQNMVHVVGLKSNIYLVDLNKTVLFDTYNIKSKDKFIEIQGKKQNGKLALKKTANSIKLDIKDMNDTFINTLLDKKLFHNGNFSLKLLGKDAKNFSAHANFTKTYLASFSFYNNLLAFINSIPALLSLKKPGFNETGYEVKNANIVFSREGKLLTIHTLDIDGVDADIGGKGTINLQDNTLDLTLKLKTFKDITKIIDKIPLINYIVLGKDKSIEIGIKVDGSLEKPNIQTEAMKEVVITPFNLIKRTITLPFNLLGLDKE